MTNDTAICPLCDGWGEFYLDPKLWDGYGVYKGLVPVGNRLHGRRICHHCNGTGTVCSRVDPRQFAADGTSYDGRLVMAIDAVREVE